MAAFAKQFPRVSRRIAYCYRLQAWIVNGVVERCGHTGDPVRGCYACGNAGELHPFCPDCHA